jgi:hypothetical protein
MSAMRENAAGVTFYRAIPTCRAPMRADPSVFGTLPVARFSILRGAQSGLVLRLVCIRTH